MNTVTQRDFQAMQEPEKGLRQGRVLLVELQGPLNVAVAVR
jgi:hypothetical protein